MNAAMSRTERISFCWRFIGPVAPAGGAAPWEGSLQLGVTGPP